MNYHNLSKLDKKTTEAQVLNPFSGDWIKAMQIVMAEMGIKPYKGKSIRSHNIFDEVGTKENIKKYIEFRLAFVRALFKKMNLAEVKLFRGMNTDSNWNPTSPN